mmetsp:Transcript_62517/g.101115  ORF Transcript_62517/g.101115 Transcript_62517/m.101115 type:complete len:346 (+) Transcript_62517:30-1067(+)
MQHYAHSGEAPRWGESKDTKARKNIKQYTSELQQKEFRYQQQQRTTWTAPVRFGRDTIKPIEENTYQHLIMAQEQEARNQKFAEDLHFENREVRGPTGTKSPLKIWIPPLRTERIKSDGLPKALAGVDVGSLLALGHIKENIKQQSAKRYGAVTYRSGSTASSKEAFWATSLCSGRAGNDYVKTSHYPGYFTTDLATAGDKRSMFLGKYSSWADSKQGSHQGASHTKDSGDAPFDIRSVGWSPNRSSLTYRAHSKYTDINYTESPMSAVRAMTARKASKRARARKKWDEAFVINHEKHGYIDTTLGGSEVQRENQRKEQEARARGLASWTGPSSTIKGDLPDFVF